MVAEPEEVVAVAAEAGELLLRCGADVARVEDTVERIARAYGIDDVDTYATPTGLFVSLGKGRQCCAVKRVRERSMALDRVSSLNALSRSLAACPVPPAEALARIEAIAKQPGPYPPWMNAVLGGLSAASSTMLVGGGIGVFMPALAAHAIVQVVRAAARTMRVPEVVSDFIAGLAAVWLAHVLHVWTGAPVSSIVAGGIMVLVPGTAFTAAVRDAMAGDLVSAGARGLEATLKAATLASGVATALYVTGGREPL